MSIAQSLHAHLKSDKYIWLIVLVLGVFSLLAVYSAAGSMAFKERDGNTEYYLIQQLVFLMLGGGLIYVFSLFKYEFYFKVAPILLILAVPLLVYTLFFGVEINDARRWVTIPWIDRTFQSSDFAKLALIIFTARFLTQKQALIKDFKAAFLPILIIVSLVCLLIAPADLSTAALLFVTCLLMMFIGRVNLKYIFLLAFIGIAGLGFIYMLGQMFPDYIRVDTWVSRINNFVNEDGNWQIQHSKMAIANGGFLGLGPGNSIQRNYLPLSYADFIYSIICEEYGLIGGLLILGLYLGLLLRCIAIVTRCPKAFGAILAMGLCLNLVIQAFANIAISVHILPTTGLTLPLISMGGTSILFTCMSLGIILSVSQYVEKEKMNKMRLSIENDDDESLA